MTVDSGGRVDVRPVNTLRDDKLARVMNQSSASWYQGQNFQFLVYQQPVWAGVDTESAVATWGPPARVYEVHGYVVLVWRHPLHVAPIAPNGS